jgi:hypothetical protein
MSGTAGEVTKLDVSWEVLLCHNTISLEVDISEAVFGIFFLLTFFVYLAFPSMSLQFPPLLLSAALRMWSRRPQVLDLRTKQNKVIRIPFLPSDRQNIARKSTQRKKETKLACVVARFEASPKRPEKSLEASCSDVPSSERDARAKV